MPHIYVIYCPDAKRASLFANLLSSKIEAFVLALDSPVRGACSLLMDEIPEGGMFYDDSQVVPLYGFTIRAFCDEYRTLLERLAPGGRVRALLAEIEANSKWFDDFIIEDGNDELTTALKQKYPTGVEIIRFFEDRDPTATDIDALLSLFATDIGG